MKKPVYEGGWEERLLRQIDPESKKFFYYYYEGDYYNTNYTDYYNDSGKKIHTINHGHYG
jgi:hypothetical protein